MEAVACKAGKGRQRQTAAPSGAACEVQTAALVHTGLKWLHAESSASAYTCRHLQDTFHAAGSSGLEYNALNRSELGILPKTVDQDWRQLTLLYSVPEPCRNGLPWNEPDDCQDRGTDR